MEYAKNNGTVFKSVLLLKQSHFVIYGLGYQPSIFVALFVVLVIIAVVIFVVTIF
jgi:hypothetical protein